MSRIVLNIFFVLLCYLNIQAQDEYFENISGIGDEGSATISWSANCNAVFVPDSLVIRFNTKKIVDSESPFWQYTPAFTSDSSSYYLEDLEGSEIYIFQIGYSADGNLERGNKSSITWTDKRQVRTRQPWGVFRFLVMVGSLGMFIYGMKTMSEGMQATAGSGLRKILGSMTRNKFTGILSGFTITGLLQSSSATTVMTVSFVNAGLITLVQSAGIMMGANIGTTVTGWLVSQFGFRIDLSAYSLVLIAFAIPFLFVRKPKIRAWGTTLIGFALLFMGLGFLKESVPSFDENSGLVTFFLNYSTIPVLGTFLFIALGAVITLIVQSSSTAMALTMTLCASGVLPFPVAAAMVLGENIGTTATAEIAALIGNVHAKRSARIHTLFNVLGVGWMVFAMPLFLKGIANFLPADPFSTTEQGRAAAVTGLAAFHSVFNITNLLILVWFVPLLVKLAIKTVRSKGEEDEEFRLEFIDSSIPVAEISIIEAKKEVAKFGEITSRILGFVRILLIETDPKEQEKLYVKIKKYEEITDRMEVEISAYLRKAATTELSESASEKVRGMLSIINDLERIGDIFYQMSKTIERKNNDKIWFTQDQRNKLKEMFSIVEKSFNTMVINLRLDEDQPILLDQANTIEKEINKKRNQLRKEYLKKIETGNYNLKSGTVYSDLFSSLEKIGDHIINVSEALTGKI